MPKEQAQDGIFLTHTYVVPVLIPSNRGSLSDKKSIKLNKRLEAETGQSLDSVVLIPSNRGSLSDRVPDPLEVLIPSNRGSLSDLDTLLLAASALVLIPSNRGSLSDKLCIYGQHWGGIEKCRLNPL